MPKPSPPSTVLEALACGILVVASEVGSILEQVIEGKTGFLVQIGGGNGSECSSPVGKQRVETGDGNNGSGGCSAAVWTGKDSKGLFCLLSGNPERNDIF